MIFKVPPIPNHSMILWLNSTAFHWISWYKRLKSSMVKFLCMQGSVPASLRASKRKDHCSPSACTSEKSQGFLSSVKDYSKTGGGVKQSSPGLVILSGSAEMLQLLPDYNTRCITAQMDFLYCGGSTWDLGKLNPSRSHFLSMWLLLTHSHICWLYQKQSQCYDFQ